MVNVLVLSFDGQFSKLKLSPNTYIVGKRGILEVTHLSDLKKDLIIRFYVIRDKNSLTRFFKSELVEKIDVLLIYYSEDVLEPLNIIKETFPSAKTLIVAEDVKLAQAVAEEVTILEEDASFQRIVETISKISETVVEIPSVFNVTHLREEITILKNFISRLDDELRKRTIDVKKYFEEKKRLEERISTLEKKLRSITDGYQG